MNLSHLSVWKICTSRGWSKESQLALSVSDVGLSLSTKLNYKSDWFGGRLSIWASFAVVETLLNDSYINKKEGIQ